MLDVIKFTVSQEHFGAWCFTILFIGGIIGSMLLCIWLD